MRLHLVFGTAAVALCLCSLELIAETVQSISPFTKACDDRFQNIQAERRLCVVAIIKGADAVEVLYSTTPGLIGKTVRVYGSPVQQGRQVPMEELATMINRIVVIGGF